MKIKRIFSLILCITMLMTFFGGAVSAASVHLSKTSITLQVGDTASLKLENASGRTKWTISNSSVCKYKSGKVTAVGEGTATITATNSGKKYKCTVTVTDTASAAKSADFEFSLAIDEKAGFVFDVSEFGGNVKISSDNSKAAKVSCSKIKNGEFTLYITGRNEGTANVTVYEKGNKSNSVVIAAYVGGEKDFSDNSQDYELNDDEPQMTAEEMTDEVIRLVNAARKEAGLSSLEKSNELCDNAAVRAGELSEYFSHTRPDGTNCFTAITISYLTAGENIAKGQHSAEQVMDAWMNSDGHRKNILSSKFGKIGVGYVAETNSWVQIFTD